MKTSLPQSIQLTALALLASGHVMANEPAAESNRQTWHGHVSAYVGQSQLDGDDWNQLDQQLSMGIIADFKKDHWPISIAIDTIVAGEVDQQDPIKNTAANLTHYLGVRKIFALNDNKFQPYVGGGISFVDASLEFKTADNKLKQSETATGSWLGVGAYYAIKPNWVMGLDVRYTEAEVDLFDIKRDLNGVNAGLTIGYQW